MHGSMNVKYIGRDEIYLPLPEIKGKGTELAICLAVNAVIYCMSSSFTANRHGPSSSVPIIMLSFTNDVYTNF